MSSQRISQRQGVKGDGPVPQSNAPDASKRSETMKKQQPDLKLRCPIRAHADKCLDNGMEVGLLACEKGKTFPAIDKLNEHLSRVHSLKYICLPCKTKFPSVNKAHLAKLRQDHTCEEKPWPKEGKHVNQWNLMSQEQHDRWSVWTSSNNERRQPEDGQREKKAFWSWRKIYERLYPNTVDFPAAFSPGERLGDDDRTASDDMEKSIDTQPRGEAEQTPVANTGVPSRPPTGPNFLKSNDPVWFVNPLSADLGVDQQRCPETESSASWLETSTGPGSMAYSSTSGTTEYLRPQTPSYNPFTNENAPDWVFHIGDAQPYTVERDMDIFGGNPEDFIIQEAQAFPK
ncbi:hypothetical protein NCS56_00521200 [Fusarium sp. Ph1]|nr:hypothetical protein NCS56_00521200 [Fusarium sp. Ph1]